MGEKRLDEIIDCKPYSASFSRRTCLLRRDSVLRDNDRTVLCFKCEAGRQNAELLNVDVAALKREAQKKKAEETAKRVALKAEAEARPRAKGAARRKTQRAGAPAKALKRDGGRSMVGKAVSGKQASGKQAHTTASKTCLRCRGKYKPSSNRQEFCPECRAANRKESVAATRAPGPNGKKPKAPATLKEITNKHCREVSREGGPAHLADPETRALLGQLMLVSSDLDEMIAGVLENGEFVHKRLHEARKRIGLILTNDLCPAEKTAA